MAEPEFAYPVGDDDDYEIDRAGMWEYRAAKAYAVNGSASPDQDVAHMLNFTLVNTLMSINNTLTAMEGHLGVLAGLYGKHEPA